MMSLPGRPPLEAWAMRGPQWWPSSPVLIFRGMGSDTCHINFRQHIASKVCWSPPSFGAAISLLWMAPLVGSRRH